MIMLEREGVKEGDWERERGERDRGGRDAIK